MDNTNTPTNVRMRAVILSALTEMLRQGIPLESIRSVLQIDDFLVSLQIEPCTKCKDLSPPEKAILDAATSTPQTRKQLARRAGYKYNTHTSQAAKHLLELGLLKPLDGGYVRA